MTLTSHETAVVVVIAKAHSTGNFALPSLQLRYSSHPELDWLRNADHSRRSTTMFSSFPGNSSRCSGMRRVDLNAAGIVRVGCNFLPRVVTRQSTTDCFSSMISTREKSVFGNVADAQNSCPKMNTTLSSTWNA